MTYSEVNPSDGEVQWAVQLFVFERRLYVTQHIQTWNVHLLLEWGSHRVRPKGISQFENCFFFRNLFFYFVLLGFFFFFGLLWAPTSHVRVWEKLGSSWNEHSDKRVTARRWRAVKDIWSRPQTPPAAAALIQALLQGRSQALAPGTATFCSTPVLPVLHFLLQKRRKGSRPESEIYIYIYTFKPVHPKNFLTSN